MATMDKLLSHQVGAGVSFSECSCLFSIFGDIELFLFRLWSF